MRLRGSGEGMVKPGSALAALSQTSSRPQPLSAGSSALCGVALKSPQRSSGAPVPPSSSRSACDSKGGTNV